MVRNLTKEALWHVKDGGEQTVARSCTIRAQQGNGGPGGGGGHFFSGLKQTKQNKKIVGDHFKGQ